MYDADRGIDYILKNETITGNGKIDLNMIIKPNNDYEEDVHRKAR